jgi:ligand-binding SRPBCC domain-containing protein
VILYSLDRAQEIHAPLDEVFAFFSNPANLARITPEWLRFRMVGAPPAALAGESRIEYRIRWGPLTLRWVTRISRWTPGVEFQDVQERGPYRTWIHTHRFTQRGRVVLMQDHVDYELPLGVLGRLAHRLRVRRQLEEIFDYRRCAIRTLFPAPWASGGEASPGPGPGAAAHP